MESGDCEPLRTHQPPVPAQGWGRAQPRSLLLEPGEPSPGVPQGQSPVRQRRAPLGGRGRRTQRWNRVPVCMRALRDGGGVSVGALVHSPARWSLPH